MTTETAESVASLDDPWWFGTRFELAVAAIVIVVWMFVVRGSHGFMNYVFIGALAVVALWFRTRDRAVPRSDSSGGIAVVATMLVVALGASLIAAPRDSSLFVWAFALYGVQAVIGTRAFIVALLLSPTVFGFGEGVRDYFAGDVLYRTYGPWRGGLDPITRAPNSSSCVSFGTEWPFNDGYNFGVASMTGILGRSAHVYDGPLFDLETMDEALEFRGHDLDVPSLSDDRVSPSRDAFRLPPGTGAVLLESVLSEIEYDVSSISIRAAMIDDRVDIVRIVGGAEDAVRLVVAFDRRTHFVVASEATLGVRFEFPPYRRYSVVSLDTDGRVTLATVLGHPSCRWRVSGDEYWFDALRAIGPECDEDHLGHLMVAPERRPVGRRTDTAPLVR